MTERSWDVLSQRYASAAMRELMSPRRRALVWRDLWIALADAERELGLPVTERQVEALREQRDNIDLDAVAALEKKLRHDVMAHIHHFGDVAPEARGILHLGATSCYVTDNGDLILQREALVLIETRLLRMVHALGRFAEKHRDLPTLGLTHLQPAQLTTLGKRASLWIQDLVEVWKPLREHRRSLPFRGVKGTTGTQASFLQLVGGDADRVLDLERRVAQRMGFEHVFALTGQTYPRVWDYRLVARLAELGVVLHKFASDLRLLQSWGEVEEPVTPTQVGSSAMPYKRNPMRSERLASLCNVLITLVPGLAHMAANQWFERTLDDSALRRITLPQAFLLADSILLIGRNLAEGLVVHEEVAARRVAEHLPFMAAEELLMEATQRGGDRQEIHERIRQLSWDAARRVKDGEPNPLRDLIAADPSLAPILESLPPWESKRFTGLAGEQTDRYLREVVSKLPVPPDDDLTDLSV